MSRASLERHRDGLPGGDERLQSGSDRRLPDRGADAPPRDRRGQGRAPADRGAPRARGHPQGSSGSLPARVLGRDEAARGDCHGTRLRAEDPPRGRADDRARRDGAGADPRAARLARGGFQPRAHPRHPRPSRSSRRSATAPRSCTRARSPSRPRSTRSSTPRSTRTRACSSPPRPISTPAASASHQFPARPRGSTSRSSGAPSSLAATARSRRVRPRRRSSSRSGERHVAACHLNDHVREAATA